MIVKVLTSSNAFDTVFFIICLALVTVILIIIFYLVHVSSGLLKNIRCITLDFCNVLVNA